MKESRSFLKSEVGTAERESPGCALLLISFLIAAGIVFFAWYRDRETEKDVDLISKRFEETFIGSTNFWPRNPWRAKGGYLVSEQFIPLRAISRKANVPIYQTRELDKRLTASTEPAKIKPWYPYYVFDIHKPPDGKDAILISESFRKPGPGEERWIDQNDAFCWTTRESINIEVPQAIYASNVDAQEKKNPLAKNYDYSYEKAWKKACAGGKKTFEIVSLPVMDKIGSRFCILTPDLSGADGYKLAWITWDGVNPGVNCRLRTSRKELTAYINNLQQLLRRYKNPELRAEAKKGLFSLGQAHLTQEDSRDSDYTIEELSKRIKGIPLVGRHSYLLKPIESDLEYRSINDRAMKLMRLDSQPIWCNEVAYIDLAMMP